MNELMGFKLVFDMCSILLNIILIILSLIQISKFKHHTYQNVQTVFLIFKLELQDSK